MVGPAAVAHHGPASDDAADERPQFARFLATFLPVARIASANHIAILDMLLGSAAALVSLRGDAGGAPFLLTTGGFLLVLLGALVVSNRLVEPNYDVILSCTRTRCRLTGPR